jgi:thiol-disulfide isomerase/thioredoxin
VKARRLLLALVVAAVSAGAARADETGLPLQGLGGGELRRADLEQGSTIVVVWASWSPKCRDIAARVNALSQRWGSLARVLTVDFQEDRGTVEAFVAQSGLKGPVYLDRDGTFAKRNAVTTLPGLLVYSGGRVAYNGRLPDDADRLLAEILR